jgi:hypothetical protein
VVGDDVSAAALTCLSTELGAGNGAAGNARSVVMSPDGPAGGGDISLTTGGPSTGAADIGSSFEADAGEDSVGPGDGDCALVPASDSA